MSERIINTAERLGHAGAERRRGGGSSEHSERIISTAPSGMAVPSASEVRA